MFWPKATCYGCEMIKCRWCESQLFKTDGNFIHGTQTVTSSFRLSESSAETRSKFDESHHDVLARPQLIAQPNSILAPEGSQLNPNKDILIEHKKAGRGT